MKTNPAPQLANNFHLDWGLPAILNLISHHKHEFKTVLEIGSGAGEHARFFRYFDKDVYSVDLHHSADYVGDFTTIELDRQFDLIWCSHVLEHQRNIGLFLEKIYQAINDNGILAITVPCHPLNRIVSGHITCWNPYILCYHLILAGFDCSQAEIFDGHEVSLIVRKKPATANDVLSPAAFELIDTLAPFFPMPVEDTKELTKQHINWRSDFKFEIQKGQSLTIHSKFIPKGSFIIAEH